MTAFTTTPGLFPRQSIRVDLAELRDVIAIRRGVSAIRDAVTADQACQRARLLLGQHRDNVDFPEVGCEVYVNASGRPRVSPFDVAAALVEWAAAHPGQVAA